MSLVKEAMSASEAKDKVVDAGRRGASYLNENKGAIAKNVAIGAGGATAAALAAGAHRGGAVPAAKKAWKKGQKGFLGMGKRTRRQRAQAATKAFASRTRSGLRGLPADIKARLG